MPAVLSLLAAAIWPVHCAGCGRPDAVLCDGCRGWRGPPRATGLPGTGLPGTGLPGPGVPVWAVSAYGGPAAALISQWKERGRHDLTGPLAHGLADALAACLASSGRLTATVVPVPSSRAARRRRGSSLVADLAVAAARELPGVAVAPALRLARRVHDQAGLGVAARRANLAGALAIVPGVALAGRDVVAVDDVVTTGATMGEAVRVLRQEGARVVGACCLSVTLRRHGVPIGGGLH